MSIVRISPLIAKAFSKPGILLLCFLSVITIRLALPASDKPAEKTGEKGAKPAAAAVLSPDNYVGKASLGYAAAKEVPDICSKLFCYCGCDMTDSHTSLLDCFTCDHGVTCTVCQDEAIIALDLKQKGKSLAEIQKEIDEAFQTMYPWQKASPALEKYRASLKSGSPAPSDPAKAGKVESLLKLSPQPSNQTKMRRFGNCCGHNGS